MTQAVSGLDTLVTELADPRFARIDELTVLELTALMNELDAEVATAVKRAVPDIAAAIEEVVARMRQGGRLIYVGAGTPGRIGVLDASECPPTFGTDPDQVITLIAGGATAIVSAVEGAEDDADEGAAAVDAAGVGPLDSVIGIASSGRTPYVIAAVRRARELGAFTAGLSCNTDTELGAVAERSIEVIVGPELVAGSTRLKAGTAQKMVLNMFSTISMVGLGKTYGNLMVDLVATNSKLRERSVRIITSITGSTRDRALNALAECGGSVKLAVLMLELRVDAKQAAQLLDAAGGRLKAAIASGQEASA
ncbi:N-acetylmuramic acid 6-phosphate etherase [Ruicaihuangia caeni]|uniref:N-acetylmuramic acid 6-phosphate etherase n=1 Tax=Ruicaihuangia caeni TaxID=3042517 RepID=UPI00338D9EF1